MVSEPQAGVQHEPLNRNRCVSVVLNQIQNFWEKLQRGREQRVLERDEAAVRLKRATTSEMHTLPLCDLATK